MIPDRVEVRITTLILGKETTMTTATMALAELAEKGEQALPTQCGIQMPRSTAAERSLHDEAVVVAAAGAHAASLLPLPLQCQPASALFKPVDGAGPKFAAARSMKARTLGDR